MQTLTSDIDTWELVAELGQGSAGSTWLVRGQRTGREAVLKRLHLAAVEGWKAVERFRQEAAILRHLDHPSIPDYIDAITDEEAGLLAIVQERAPGRSVRDHMTAPGRAEPGAAEVAGHLQRGLEVLRYLHALVPPVVHRDVSAGNVILGDGATFLVDFGAVRLAVDTETVTTMGTFGYMAPEQAMGRAVPASDLYGLGMTMLAFASGRAPDAMPLDPATGQVAVRQLVDLPDPLTSVLESLTAPGLAQRARSAEDALSALRAPPPTPDVSPRRGGARRPGLLRALALILSAALLLGGARWATTLVGEEHEVATLGGWFTGHPRFGRSAFVHDVAWSPDGERIVSAAGDELLVWSASDGGLEQTLTTGGDREFPGAHHAVFTPEGTLFTSAGAIGALWTLPDGAHQDLDLVGPAWRRFGSDQRTTVRGLAAPLPAGVLVAAFEVWGEQVGLVDATRGELLWSAELAGDYAAEVAVARGAPILAWGTGKEHRFALVDLSSGRTLHQRPAGRTISSLGVDPTGRVAVIAGTEDAALIDVRSGSDIAVIADRFGRTTDLYGDRGLAWAPDGGRLALAHDRGVNIYDTTTGLRQLELGPWPFVPHALTFSPDGTRLAVASLEDRIHIFEVAAARTRSP